MEINRNISLLDSVKREIKLNEELLNFLQQHEYTDVLNWFKDLCKHMSKTILIISKYHKNEKLDESSKNGLLLYLWQMLTALGHLINVFVEENNIKQNLWLSRDYTKKQLQDCFAGILEILSLKTETFEPPNFMELMDIALESIENIQNLISGETQRTVSTDDNLRKNFVDTKNCIEDVLCHSMSIAQVLLKTDYVILRGKVQTVLESLDSLSKEISKTPSNTSMIKLYTDSCNDKLYSLERSLNNSVLKLTLKVFSEFSQPLELICNACNNEKNMGNREDFENSINFDTLVVNFDLHVDRIMQIGLFAATCSINMNQSIKIRSCLASLESLETELVPAFTATLKHPTAQNLNHALLLKGHWLQQASLLKKYIYLIIDPFAFCQIVYLESKQAVDSYTESLKSYTRETVRDHVENLIKLGDVLKEFIKVISSEIKNEAEKIQIVFEDFLKVFNEVQIAKSVLLSERKFNPENNVRMLKRCKILLTQIKKICSAFSDESQNENEQISKEFTGNSSQNSSNDDQKKAVNNPFLEHIIQKGKQILKERSVLFKTPQKSSNKVSSTFSVEHTDNVLKSNENIFSKPKSLRKLCFLKHTVESTDMTTMDLQITDILNELTNMTDTFNS